MFCATSASFKLTEERYGMYLLLFFILHAFARDDILLYEISGNKKLNITPIRKEIVESHGKCFGYCVCEPACKSVNILADNSGGYVCELLPYNRCLKRLMTGVNFFFYDTKNNCGKFRIQLTIAANRCARRNELNSVVAGDCTISPETLFSYENNKLKNGNLCVAVNNAKQLHLADCSVAPICELLLDDDGLYIIKFPVIPSSL